MVYFFLGINSLAKAERLRQLAQECKAEVTHFWPEDILPSINEMAESTLFGGIRLFVVRGGTSRLDRDTDLPRLARSPHVIVIWEDKLDKRKTTTNAWLKDSSLTLEQFDPPISSAVPQWLVKRAGELGSAMNLGSARYFQQRIMPEQQAGRFGEQPVDVWRLENELAKLCAYVGNGAITDAAIDAVITDYNLVETWDITNALAERNQARAFVALERFFNATDTTDEKTKTIQLNAALAEQFRTILMVQDMTALGIPDSEVLARTGWKSGRLFVIKKLAGKFTPKNVISTLEKLHQLDKELKSSSTPGQTVLSLIAAQIG